MSKIQYKNYLLILLTLVGVSNFLDRQILALALESIKHDFDLSDVQLGFLSGFAFALFYALAGVPIARWADRGNRNIIVSVTAGLWGIMLLLCGLVGNFTQLLLVRVGVAVGEAGCVPPAQSLIADYFDRSERPHAMAIYWLCSPLAVLIGFLIGGWLIELMGWRNTFMVMGGVGIILAVLARLTLREPRVARPTRSVVAPPSFRSVFTLLWQQATFRCVVVAFCVAYFFTSGLIQWLPSFFIRSYGMTAGEVGAWLAVLWGLGGLIGTYVGGILASRYARDNEALQMKACAVVFSLGGLFYILLFLSSSQHQAMIYLAFLGLLTTMCNGVIFSAIQSLANEHMRSTALAVIFLLANLIGFGLGPIATGLLSDLLNPMFGQESLRYALTAFSPGLIWSGYYYWKASGTIEADIESVESQADSIEEARIAQELDTQNKKQRVLFDR